MTSNSGMSGDGRPPHILPAGTWDCHTHVFGPRPHFPLAPGGAYEPPSADRDLHLATLDRLGFDHALLIQPSLYGDDHSALLDALRHGQGRLLGVGSVSATIDRDRLAALRSASVVALRFVGVPGPDGGPYPGTQGFDQLEDLRSDMRALGLHAHVWGSLEQCADLALGDAGSDMPLVFDHLAGLSPDDRPGTYRFDRLLDAIATGMAWVKLTYFRRSALPGAYSDMQPVVSALVDAAPHRVIWGSDWPFVRTAQVPDPSALLNQLRSWVGEEAFRRCLSDNPAALLGMKMP
ncbi:putative TIM-barrel fold metal-dependent hydrolase [Sphingobium sp. B2D3A]|uniref:amidohydrolase family protein n=1 Tax=unclassified Sphingobium TaxID=2611147 RepID=UPI00222422CC|nr:MULTISPECIES: amidohydrolase family protein [unclassified Sphingobium]MCW2336692.1 putative TIM-barrel fold metal-dependent hydrolase [Sphingobium sp. B2D3A]MCW2386446.1 putative TIM-barrel fold metal-dependent hydrolase [Sphingobium sp. B2D3D]